MDIDLSEDYGFRLFVLFLLGLFIYFGSLVIGTAIIDEVLTWF